MHILVHDLFPRGHAIGEAARVQSFLHVQQSKCLHWEYLARSQQWWCRQAHRNLYSKNLESHLLIESHSSDHEPLARELQE